MKNNIDYVPAVKNLLDSVFDTYLDADGRTNTIVKKKPTPHELLESDDDFILKIYVPGFSKKDFDIKIEEGKLIISSISKSEIPEGYKVVRSTYLNGQVYKAFKLDEKVDAENIKASYDQGILALNLPKSNKEIKRTITID